MTNTPNRERIQKWVDKLLSGEIEQAQSRLRRDASMCCLGVACEVYRKETGEGEWSGSFFGKGNKGNMTFLPSFVFDWYGLPDNDPYLFANDNFSQISTSALNDSYRFNFEEIAEAIKRTYLD